MIGFPTMRSLSLQNPVVQGQQLGWQIGQRTEAEQRWAVQYGGNETMMEVIATALKMSDLQGFTLFRVKAGWQMSTRRKDEFGWEVKIIPDEQAQAVFRLVERAGYSGPAVMKVFVPVEGMRIDAAIEATRVAVDRLTEALAAWVA